MSAKRTIYQRNSAIRKKSKDRFTDILKTLVPDNTNKFDIAEERKSTKTKSMLFHKVDLVTNQKNKQLRSASMQKIKEINKDLDLTCRFVSDRTFGK